MPRPTSFYHVCCPRDIMSYHARSPPIMCAFKGLWWHAMREIVWSCVLSKRIDEMTRPILSYPMCFPWARMTCQAQHNSFLCIVQGGWGHLRPDIIRTPVLFKGYDWMPCPMSSYHVCLPRAMMSGHALRHPTMFVVQELWWPAMPKVVQFCVMSRVYDGTPHPTSFDNVSCQREMM